MVRVKIKTNNNDGMRHLKLLETLSKHDIYATKLNQTNDGFAITIAEDSDLDRLFNNVTDQALLKENFSPQIPPQLKANRSILLTNVDNHISENEHDEIKEEILKHNEWVTSIIQVHKFPSGRIIKITFSDSQQARKAQEAGLKLFYMKIPPFNIKQDQYHHINVCLRCYELDSHNTYQCRKGKEYKICSECSEEDHTHRTCKANFKKCVNCGGEHGTMSMRCPKKKELINNKRAESENTTYAGTAKKGATLIPEVQPVPQISSGTYTRIIQLTVNAHFLNVERPGSYEEELNKGFKANNLPTIKIPTVPNSKKILTELMPGLVQPAEHNQAERSGGKKRDIQEKMETTTNKEEGIKITQVDQSLKGTELGMKIHTSKSTGWPKGTLTLKHITRNLKEGKYKYTYTYPQIEDSEMMSLLTNNCIELTPDCFEMQDDGVFRKIRPGLVEELTPPRGKEERKRIDSK